MIFLMVITTIAALIPYKKDIHEVSKRIYDSRKYKIVNNWVALISALCISLYTNIVIILLWILKFNGSETGFYISIAAMIPSNLFALYFYRTNYEKVPPKNIATL